MNDVMEFNNETFFSTISSFGLDKKKIDQLKENADKNSNGKFRLCAHTDPDKKLHDMIIVHKKKSYVRPHKHTSKQESIHVIEGEANIVFFSDTGKIKKTMKIGDYNSGRTFYYKLGESEFHTLIINSEYLIFHESTTGPFNRDETVFAEWAPELCDNKGIKDYIGKLKEAIK